MLKKLVTGAGCVVLGTWLSAPGAVANRGTRPPEVPPTSPPSDEAPPAVPSPPSEAASPPSEAETPPLVPRPEPPPVPQVAEPPTEEETPRVFAGAVTDPPLPPAPVTPPRPAPVRLPFTGAGDDALPLAGAALTLGGLALMAGQPVRPAPVGLLHSDNAAISSGPGDGGDGRRRGRRLWRFRGR